MTKQIKVTSGTGIGETKLSAFDSALFDAGIANYNLIYLSSVIPENHQPVVEKVNYNNKEFGYRLYVVMSSQTENEIGREAWAGLGWVTTKEGIKKGLFVEHHGSNEEEVVSLIKESLTSMVEYREDSYGEITYKIVGVKCEDKPVCAVVSAIYKSESWEN